MIRFVCQHCAKKLEVTEKHEGQRVKCPQCKRAVAVPTREEDLPEALAITDEPKWFAAIYWSLLAVGAVIAIYLYLVAFDRLSETTLVALTPVWVFPLVFGAYGFVAQQLMRLVEAGRAADLREAARIWTGAIGWFGLVLLFPFLLLAKWRNSLATAFVASAVWGVGLVVFFSVVFPRL